jgi:hypothetical protein
MRRFIAWTRLKEPPLKWRLVGSSDTEDEAAGQSAARVDGRVRRNVDLASVVESELVGEVAVDERLVQ